MSIKKMLVGTTASLLLAGGFSTTVSAEEDSKPVEESVVKKDSGIDLPSDMKVGDTYTETVPLSDGEEVTYNIEKISENLDDEMMSLRYVSPPRTVPVRGTATFNVAGTRGLNNMSFRLTTRSGLIDRVDRPVHSFITSVTSDRLVKESGRLASYTVNTSAAVPWIGGPSFNAILEASIVSPGVNQNINTLYTEMY